MHRLAAPWYLHPALDGDAWQAMRAAGLAFAVVNVHNGPGSGPDPDYATVLRPASTTPLISYVDVAYGGRPFRDVCDDVRRWSDLYGITGIFLDQVPETEALGDWRIGRVDELRALGCDRVVANPGTPPAVAVIREADVTCVIETDWTSYHLQRLPEFLADEDPDRQWHLVHSVPAWADVDIVRTAAERGAALSWATRGRLPNPWAEGWDER